jgi:D-alanyl-D-alanine carboxypeptidase
MAAPTLIRSMTRRGSSLRVACTVLLVALAAAVAPFATTGAAGAAGGRVAQAQGAPPKAYIVVDATTGEVLLADHEHDAFPPASIAKIMTAVTAAERLPADAVINVSPLAAGQPASRINMQAGQHWPFEQAIASLMMASANDAAYAIAENAGGSLDGFVAEMNQTAHRLKMKDSTFSDPAGLDDKTSFDGGPRMSAYDIAIATRNALTVPEITKWASMRKYQFVDPTGLHRSLTNHNKMLPGSTRGYPWATGMKTGYTERAGHTLAATATRDGRTLVAVVLNTYDIYGWGAQLLDQGFATPSGSGTGVRLPALAVSPYGARVAEQQAFAAIARGTTPSPAEDTTGASTSDTTGTTAPATTTTTHRPSSRLDGDTIAAQQAASDDDGGGGWFTWKVILPVIVVLVLAFFLRRRAVRRQRVRRIARQRMRAAKIRSGGLTVVDGRYRAGDRTGPPVESHVQVRPFDETRRDPTGRGETGTR